MLHSDLNQQHGGRSRNGPPHQPPCDRHHPAECRLFARRGVRLRLARTQRI